MSSLGSSLGFGGGVLATGAMGMGPDPCGDLATQIAELVDELKKRFFDLLEDKHGLQHGHWSKADAHPDLGSVEGHQEQFQGKQRRLRRLLNEFDAGGCGDGQSIPVDAWEWATRKTPEPRVQPAPQSASRDIDWGAVKDVVIALGLSIALVGVILWAVLSPDPLGELTLAGIGPGMATQICLLLGIAVPAALAT